MKSILNWLQRLYDKYKPNPLRELTCHGNWRVIYPNGEHTFWMDYSSASNLATVFGGRVIHRNQQQEN